MSIPLVYPSTLPCPTATSVQRLERRALSSNDLRGPRESRAISVDKVSAQPLEFLFRSQAQLQAWVDWYVTTLHNGSAWFAASWPQPEGGVGVRRFLGAPSYPEYIPPKKMWRVVITCQIRGRGMLPTDDSDEFWSQVLLHLNGDDLSNFLRDWSPLHINVGKHGTPMLNTELAKYGPGCIDLDGGDALVANDHTYSDPMGAGEFTLRWWMYITGMPLNLNRRLALFGPFQLEIAADGSANGLSTEINDASGGGRTAYTPSTPAGTYGTNRWIHSALVRTNGLGLAGHDARIDLFVDGQIQTPSSTFTDNSTAGTTGFFTVGGGGTTEAGTAEGTACLIDDFQLTAGVNRYRGLTSFTPPGKLPTR